jgi:hypothetical protein
VTKLNEVFPLTAVLEYPVEAIDLEVWLTR